MASDSRMFQLLGTHGFVTYSNDGISLDMNEWQFTSGTGMCICIGPVVTCAEAFRVVNNKNNRRWNEMAVHITQNLQHQVARLRQATSIYRAEDRIPAPVWRLWWGLGVWAYLTTADRIDTDDD